MTPQIEKLAREYAEQFKTQVSSEGLQNIATDFIAGYTAALSQSKQDEAVEKLKEAFVRIWNRSENKEISEICADSVELINSLTARNCDNQE